MLNNKKISGMVVLSEAQWLCYPYIEAISSFLPVVDEMVVAFNVYGREDGSRKKVAELGDKIRIVSTVFDIERYGWVSYGIARSMGYQACKGDIVLMFDADTVLHEDDHEKLNKELVGDLISTPSTPTGSWGNRKFYKPNLYYRQYKFPGIYNKEALGDRFDFFYLARRGAPNYSRLKETEQRTRQFDVVLFGYEHLWDTEEILRYKLNRYGRMSDELHKEPFKTPEEYFEHYMMGLKGNLSKKGQNLAIENHPKVMQEKLRGINESHFGHSFFGRK